MTGLLDEYLASTILGGVCAALGMVLLVSQGRSRANVGSSVLLICFGLGMLTAFPLVDSVDRSDPGLIARSQVCFEGVGIAAGALYLRGLWESADSKGRRAESTIRVSVLAIYVLAGLHVVLGFAFPGKRLDDYELGIGSSEVATSGFWLFATLLIAVATAFAIGWFTLARQDLDRGEHVRAVCNMTSAPFFLLTTALPPRAALICGSAALVIYLFGQFRYLVAEGERGAFLSRFLSPQVAAQVRVDGLTTVMRPGEVELTVVACDLRGFTAYAEGVPSQAVIDLLGEYYGVVGTAVAEVGGTIKDYAGDGILILLGAPLPHPDHAAAGLILAERIHEVTRPVMNRWATAPHPLGIGVGVATGRVTVGAIGSDARMEYTAVGTPVNLAARLCSAATAGQTLLDATTAASADPNDVEAWDHVALKGLSHTAAVHSYMPKGTQPAR